MTRLPNGDVRVIMETENAPEIAAWIRGFGEDVFVESPAELRKEVAASLRRAAERYEAT